MQAVSFIRTKDIKITFRANKLIMNLPSISWIQMGNYKTNPIFIPFRVSKIFKTKKISRSAITIKTWMKNKEGSFFFSFIIIIIF